MPQHRMVLDDIHHFISRDSLVHRLVAKSWCRHKTDTLDARPAVSARLAHPLPFG